MSKKYSVTNEGGGTQVIYSAKRTPVSIAPGQTVSVELSDETLWRLRDLAPSLRVGGDGEEPVSMQSELSQEQEQTQESTDSSISAQSLLASYENKEISYAELVKRSRVVLGERMPEGIPKKAELVPLLRG